MAKLSITRHNKRKIEFELEKEVTSIGKNDAAHNLFNDLAFDDDTVSRRHARIFREGTHYYIEDLNSKNHTYVNDQRVRKARLKDGDEIKIGFNSLLFQSETAQHSVPRNIYD